MERGFVIRDLIKQLITISLLYFLMGIWWGDEQWFKDKVKELSFFLSVGFMFFTVSLGTSLISRPVTIQISQLNKHYNNEETRFSIVGKRKTQEHERVVDLQITIIKSKSIWGLLVGYILKKMEVSILVEPVTSGIVLEADNESIRQDISETTVGFKINIGPYLENVINRSNIGSQSKGCEYLISENRSDIVSNETFQITPIFLTKDKIAPLWLTSLVRFENPSHIVFFKWE